MTFTIRRAAPSDLPATLELLERAEMYTSSVTFAGEVTYLLGEAGGCPVAALGLEHGEGASLLRSFTVHSSFRGRGWAGQMLEHAYALLRERGDHEVFLFSADEGSFWAHQGYHRVAPQVLAQRLPLAPQVRSALEAGWLTDALAWHRILPGT